MTMTYVFPDLHGRKDHLDKAIAGVFADGLGPVRVIEVHG